jgi:hypothetical protein
LKCAASDIMRTDGTVHVIETAIARTPGWP